MRLLVWKLFEFSLYRRAVSRTLNNLLVISIQFRQLVQIRSDNIVSIFVSLRDVAFDQFVFGLEILKLVNIAEELRWVV